MTVAEIDVLLPVYNAALTLDSALRSIAAQTMDNFRVLTIDNGSTDASPDILARWAMRDQRFHVVRQPNGGIVSALNAGLALSTAPYIARMDADDISLPERFAAQLAYLHGARGAAGVGCGIVHIDADNRRVYGLPVPGPPSDADPDWVPAREPYIVHPFLMARRNAMVAAGGYRHVPSSEDSDLYWRLSERGTLHNLHEPLGHYRMHALSVSGASIEAGRVMAVGSQLGALSARRRRSGIPDLVFDSKLSGKLRRARSLAGMWTVASAMASGEEIPAFRLSVALKLLELARYRPFEIEPQDCQFVRAALMKGGSSRRENDQEIRWSLTDTASRLLRKGRVWDAAVLLPFRFAPRAIAKSLRILVK